MSIQIQKSNCIGCGKCIEVCPGNLIKKDNEGRAYIKYIRDCWGCTSCIKECKAKAIKFYLGADIGGKGSTLLISEKDGIRTWEIEDLEGKIVRILTNKKDANKC